MLFLKKNVKTTPMDEILAVQHPSKPKLMPLRLAEDQGLRLMQISVKSYDCEGVLDM